ncbi:hypothetical protein [Jeotgalibacillus campisalis]|uniref:DUF3278 domain-containing protein n=1 Tax=Jeotgalibacillus campisalis TaxID=220754 RepID=A0A0C2W946_9BACL|nr:hypothetical protein [Jeotgalibacillus campisalis]KIL53106.1 hypothetical protein KR50_04350 [Jeotgalibacillus campisalis]
MKTWVSLLLPNDEYKEKKILAFLAEGGSILFLALIFLTIIKRYTKFDAETVLLIAVGVFILYISGRYILSGIEYTEVATEKAYVKERYVILVKSLSFILIFCCMYFIFIQFPATWSDWAEILGFLLTVFLLMFLSSYISLKRSYKKNKELI